MGIFRKSAQQKRIDELVAENARLSAKVRAALADLATTSIDLANIRDSRDIALRNNAHLRTENEQLRARLQPFIAPRQRGERGRFLKVKAQPAHH